MYVGSGDDVYYGDSGYGDTLIFSEYDIGVYLNSTLGRAYAVDPAESEEIGTDSFSRFERFYLSQGNDIVNTELSEKETTYLLNGHDYIHVGHGDTAHGGNGTDAIDFQRLGSMYHEITSGNSTSKGAGKDTILHTGFENFYGSVTGFEEYKLNGFDGINIDARKGEARFSVTASHNTSLTRDGSSDKGHYDIRNSNGISVEDYGHETTATIVNSSGEFSFGSDVNVTVALDNLGYELSLSAGQGATQNSAGPELGFSFENRGVFIDLSKGTVGLSDGEIADDINVAGFSDLVGTGFDDHLIGNDADNKLNGSWGNDHLVGLSGDDRLIGALGNDLLEGGYGSDTLDGGAGNDTLVGGQGANTFEFFKNVSNPDFGDDLIADFSPSSPNDEFDVLRFLSVGFSNKFQLLDGTEVLNFGDLDSNEDGVVDRYDRVAAANADGGISPLFQEGTITLEGVSTLYHDNFDFA